MTKLLVQTWKIMSKSNFCPTFVQLQFQVHFQTFVQYLSTKKKCPIFFQHLSKLFGLTTILKEHQSELKCVFTFNFTSHFKQVVIQPNMSSVWGPNILSHPLDGMDSIWNVRSTHQPVLLRNGWLDWFWISNPITVQP